MIKCENSLHPHNIALGNVLGAHKLRKSKNLLPTEPTGICYRNNLASFKIYESKGYFSLSLECNP